MKKAVAVLALAMTMSVQLPTWAAAESYALNGLVLGAGSGAIIGQAVGRNTKGTVVGAAIGSALGYAIGSEMDYGRSYRAGYSPTVYERPRPVVIRPESREVCRETEILAMVGGRPETIYGTACWQDGEWVMIADEPPPPSFITRTVFIGVDDHHRHRGGHRHRRECRWDGDDHERDHDRGRHKRKVTYRERW